VWLIQPNALLYFWNAASSGSVPSVEPPPLVVSPLEPPLPPSAEMLPSA